MTGPGSRAIRRVATPVTAAMVSTVVVLAFVTDASAYRPFVSTDAAVADPKEVEIELGYFTLERDKDENSFIIPCTVVRERVLWEKTSSIPRCSV